MPLYFLTDPMFLLVGASMAGIGTFITVMFFKMLKVVRLLDGMSNDAKIQTSLLRAISASFSAIAAASQASGSGDPLHPERSTEPIEKPIIAMDTTATMQRVKP